MSRPLTGRSERVSLSVLQERSARVAALKARLAGLVDPLDRFDPNGDPGRLTTANTAITPSPDDHLAASFPPDLQYKIKVRSQALRNTLQALSHASSKISTSSAALQADSDTRIQDLLVQVDVRRALALKELSTLFRVERSEERKVTEDVATLNFDNQWSGNDLHDGTIQTSTMHIPHVTICGCAIDPSTWQHAAADDDGSRSSPAADRETSIALGYAAEIVSIASNVLNLPLRYPITLRGSHSVIADAEVGVAGRRVFPLFVGSSKDGRAKFANAVFLLNKNITQLRSFHQPDAAELTKDFLGLSLVELLQLHAPAQGQVDRVHPCQPVERP